MGREIHTIKSNGKYVYRLWSTIVDAYVSEPIDKIEDLEKILLNNAVHAAVKNFKEEFPHRVKRAEKSGTSSHVNSRQRTDDWDEEREQ